MIWTSRLVSDGYNSKEHKNPALSLVKPCFGLCFLKSKPPNRNELAPAVLFASYLIIFFPFTMYTLLGNDTDGLRAVKKADNIHAENGLESQQPVLWPKRRQFSGVLLKR